MNTAINDLTRQIPEELGTPFASGSFGRVYRCSIKTTKGEAEVAVKVIMSDPSKAVEEFEKRIRRELKVWLRLKHPTIVPLLGIAYIDPPLMALVSLWMPSGTLRIYLKEATAITFSTKVGLAKGVVDGLNYLHSENVIHGDLHPDNVLIDGSGNPCLTDFGLATVKGEAELQLNTTTAEHIFNSRWRAPEVIGIERGPERPDFKSDIYSFGGIMFFILSGDMPWKERTSIQICIALWNKTVHARPENILDDQWNLIQQCWSWKPGNRPSAADILVSIDSDAPMIVDDGPVVQHVQDLNFGDVPMIVDDGSVAQLVQDFFGGGSQQAPSDSLAKVKVECSECGAIVNRHNWRRHLKEVHEMPRFRCDRCGNAFRRGYLMKVHQCIMLATS
jgi:serine/threonine protein kinase